MALEQLPELHGIAVREALEARVLQEGDLLVVRPQGAKTTRCAVVVQGEGVVVLSTAQPLASAEWVIERAVRGLEVVVAPDPIEE
jgi:hypothetical protein